MISMKKQISVISERDIQKIFMIKWNNKANSNPSTKVFPIHSDIAKIQELLKKLKIHYLPNILQQKRKEI